MEARLRSAPRRMLWRLAALAAAIVVINLSGGWLAAALDLKIWPKERAGVQLVVVALVVAYVVAMALPFVPGIELGLALMLLLGPPGILLVYLCTQFALALSFLVGRLVPARSLAALFRRLRMERARRLVESLEEAPPPQRLEALVGRIPGGWCAALLRHRHAALAVALNLPGNALVGGAGGLGMLAGLSRVFSFPAYALLIAAATAPVPLFLLFGGAG
jgi:hypothetical protein